MTKTALMKSQVNYLGFIVGKAGITMNRQYRSALLDFPPPTSGERVGQVPGDGRVLQTVLTRTGGDLSPATHQET